MSRPDIDAIESFAKYDPHAELLYVRPAALLNLCAYIRTLEADQSAAISQEVQVERERGEENYRAFAETCEAYWKLEAAVKAHAAARASGRSVDIGETYRNLVAALRSEGASHA